MSDDHVFASVLAAVEAFQGYGIERLSLPLIESGDAMEISLLPFSGRPWMASSIRDLRFFAMDREPRDEIAFFDFTALVIKPHEAWPAGLPAHPPSGTDGPSLSWLHGDGPTASFDVVAAVVQVLTEFGP